ncbi:hypothetical protein [Amycolatopsis tucumanensis]|uniref:Uncharacterized protein n=1 Tax=Amycolatopsis tucumanensis TaxID=401106 RepID=A0ABP7JY70_9PSEU|nr:hypothetical protein [Amycolatopsis tucumanensis]MCF6428490.1 hypothetical protein [Amycolatopsis tucumanensis]
MTTVKRGLPVRWLLLAVVALALVIMHHTPAQHGSDSGTHAVVAETAVMDVAYSTMIHPDSGDTGMAAMLHQCLAVFGQVAFWAFLLLVGMVFIRLTAGRRLVVRSLVAAGPDPPRRGDGRSILNSVCVLRL